MCCCCCRSVIAERVGPVCASNDGYFLAAGGISGRIYIWDLLTGNLLNAVSYNKDNNKNPQQQKQQPQQQKQQQQQQQ